MQQRSIGQQIKSISVLLIVGMLVLACVSVAATMLVRSVFVDYRDTTASTLEASNVFEDLFEARLAALKWRATDDAARADDFYANVAEVRGVADRLAQQDPDGALTATVSQLNQDISQYSGYFDRILAAQATRKELDAAMVDLGQETRQNLTQIMQSAYTDGDLVASYHAGRTQESLILGRFYTERYRATEVSGDLDTARGHLTTAEQSLVTLISELQNPRRLGLARAAQTSLTSYVENAEQLSTIVETGIETRTQMDLLGPKMLAEVEIALDQIVATQQILGARGKSIAFWAVLAIVGLSGTIVALAWSNARRSAGAVASNIQHSVDVMGRIAQGDLETEVLHTDQANEIGQIARALEVFKANGKASAAAAQRERELELERQQEEEARKHDRETREAAAREQAEALRKEMTSNLNQSLGSVVSAASRGDFSQRVDLDFSDSELQCLASSVNRLVETVEHGLTETGKALERVASGDLTERLEGDFQGAFAHLQMNTNGMIEALQLLVGEISGSGETLVSSSAELRDTSDSLSRQAEQNAEALEQTSAALEQLSHSIKLVSEGVSDANKNARIASRTAQDSGQVAADAAASMGKISDASSEISQVVSVITDIAFQINLLALNAGVEAARAGDAGRGFAVVAAEVRQLAQRASEASNDISSVILRSDEAVSEGVAKVADAQASLETISDSVVGISNRVEEISSSLSAQVTDVSEITAAVSQIDRNTQRQVASFEEVTAASALLSDEAEELKQSTGRFKSGHKSYATIPEAAPSGQRQKRVA